jgi:hypothetical protein
MITFPLISRRRRTRPASERPEPAAPRHRPDTMPRLRWY